jgi:hypothetical protein
MVDARSKRCVICGGAFTPRTPGAGGHNRKICYGDRCMEERDRRYHRKGELRGYMRHCAVCGEKPHVGRVCA